MKYTEYFAKYNKEQGVFPALKANDFARLMNIVSLESKIEEVRKMRDEEKSAFVYSPWIGEEIRLNGLLLSQVGNDHDPVTMLKEMIERASENTTI